MTFALRLLIAGALLHVALALAIMASLDAAYVVEEKEAGYGRC